MSFREEKGRVLTKVRNDKVTMAPEFRVVIPTRDSARWIGTFLTAYRNLGINPLYLVDSRSVDGTAATLLTMGADTLSITPKFNRVESALSLLPQLLVEDWAVRFDDDEFPSAELISWFDKSLSAVAEPAIALSRRDSLLRDDKLFYSRLEDYYGAPHPTRLNLQWRVFRHRLVTYNDAIHTPGFLCTEYAVAPDSAFFVHFDWLIRSYEERLQKIRSYEQQVKGSGMQYAKFYLPELHDQHDLRLTPFETGEFDVLARALANPAMR